MWMDLESIKLSEINQARTKAGTLPWFGMVLLKASLVRYSKKFEKHTCTSICIRALQLPWYESNVSVHQTKNIWYILIAEYYWAMGKNMLTFTAMWMDMESLMLSEINTVWYHLHVESKKIQLVNKKEADSELAVTIEGVTDYWV